MSNIGARSSATSFGDVEMVFIYTTSNFAEAEIITDIFEAEDIAYMEKREVPPQFPVSAGDADQIRIAVEDGRLDIARGLIQQAIVDEAIPGDGNFLIDL